MTLLSFGRFYESINSMLLEDRPDDKVIEDDEALDRWYQAYVREQTLKAAKRSNAGGAFADTVQIPQFGG
jgi:hypothetical protein